mmetsp:Transcript_43028/g.99648  ORF Transcript_43028/g.99648 Transcript_43028/m.99648 type:complete len:248 (+) Transcript_43028:253-996(+)
MQEARDLRGETVELKAENHRLCNDLEARDLRDQALTQEVRDLRLEIVELKRENQRLRNDLPARQLRGGQAEAAKEAADKEEEAAGENEAGAVNTEEDAAGENEAEAVAGENEAEAVGQAEAAREAADKEEDAAGENEAEAVGQAEAANEAATKEEDAACKAEAEAVGQAAAANEAANEGPTSPEPARLSPGLSFGPPTSLPTTPDWIKKILLLHATLVTVKPKLETRFSLDVNNLPPIEETFLDLSQ